MKIQFSVVIKRVRAFFRPMNHVRKGFGIAAAGTVKKMFGLFGKLPRLCAALFAVAVIMAGGLSALALTDSVSAVRVLLNNHAVGYVKDPSVIASAQVLAADTVSNSACHALLAVPTTQKCMVSEKELLSAEALSKIIISGSSDITQSAFLCLDGQAVAKADTSAEIEGLLADYLNQYKQEKGLESAAFSNRVSVCEEYVAVRTLAEMPQLSAYMAENVTALPVDKVYTTTEIREIAYKTEEVQTDTLYVGSSKIKTTGIAGQEKITYRVSVSDAGQETKTEISTEQLRAPVNQTVYIGTKKIYSSDKNGTASMLWPVQRVAGSYVSSYMGDGRGHKGMDIVAKAGTPVYAAAAGTVTFAGYSSGYGNYIIISHGNGLETLYGHNSALYVSKGDKVAAGESIAAVGRTGNATGNHVHFEVHVNGAVVNPVPYIGVN